ncbi:MAG: sulfotransferase, partial [Symploca sp. SIO2E9]|nr:sulfotransferase [Symploca sp. SIO2E9]
NQAETCKRLYHFLGCEFSNDYLFYKRQADPYQQRWDWIPEASEPFNTKHAIKWKKQMSLDDIDRITKLTDWFIEKYQY